jgi:hypothetical protein
MRSFCLHYWSLSVSLSYSCVYQGFLLSTKLMTSSRLRSIGCFRFCSAFWRLLLTFETECLQLLLAELLCLRFFISFAVLKMSVAHQSSVLSILSAIRSFLPVHTGSLFSNLMVTLGFAIFTFRNFSIASVSAIHTSHSQYLLDRFNPTTRYCDIWTFTSTGSWSWIFCLHLSLGNG